MCRPENPEDLVDLRIPRKEGTTLVDHLREDAPDRPHVYRRPIVSRAKEDFGCPIPERYDLYHVSSRGEVRQPECRRTS